VDTLDKAMIHASDVMDLDDVRFQYNAQNTMQVRTYELIISGISHVIFLDCIDHG
jgi:aspartate 1-decarboxylase